MPLVATYTNKSLAEYMSSIAVRQVDDLGWTSGNPTDDTDLGNFEQPVMDVAMEMGVQDISEVPIEGVYELRLRARVATWQSLAEAYVGLYQIGGLSRTLYRQQLYEHCVQMWDRALQGLLTFLANDEMVTGGGRAHSEVRRVKIVWGTSDPYNPDEDVVPS